MGQGWQRGIIWMIAALLLFWLVWDLLFSNHGYPVYRKEKIEISKLKQQIADLQVQRKKLVKEILRLRHDPKTQEKLVHQRLGYLHPDEFVILHPEELPTH
ncbi:MAG: septum formation initiator family protein [Mariprofundales bacterium]|nr:septum formation initiator family protein [Mariprofundales bacterium]